MRHGRQAPVLLIFALIAAGSVASPARAAESKIVAAELETPFVLVVGETGRVEAEGLEVTLRSASDDSGCLAPDDCSVATFNGTLGLRLNEKRDLATVQAIIEPGQSVSLTFAGYEIRFGEIRRLGKDRIQATFEVTKAPEKEEEREEKEDGPDR
jgi:hypothetical protein